MFPAKKAIASSRPFFILYGDDLQKIADAAAAQVPQVVALLT